MTLQALRSRFLSVFSSSHLLEMILNDLQVKRGDVWNRFIKNSRGEKKGEKKVNLLRLQSPSWRGRRGYSVPSLPPQLLNGHYPHSSHGSGIILQLFLCLSLSADAGFHKGQR